MVKLLWMLSASLLVGCAGHQAQSVSTIVACELRIDLIKSKLGLNDSLSFSISNPGDSDIKLSEPSCLVNTYVDIYDEANRDVTRLLVYKADFRCRQKFITIPAKSSFNFTYPLLLSKQFNISANHNYMVKLKYEGEVISGGRTNRCNNLILSQVISITD
jgi:hypothetical protein